VRGAGRHSDGRLSTAAARTTLPELIEVELYRRLADRTVGRRIARVDAPDPWFCKRGADPSVLEAALVGELVEATRRRGKLLLLDLSGGSVLGLRFGMTGRLLVDGAAAIDRLEYSSGRDDPAWVRFALVFDVGDLQVADPRRLGGGGLHPDEERLGVDALAMQPAELRRALAGGRGPLKARLLDQARIAGIGNLIVDEALWRAGLAPDREAGGLQPAEVRRLHRHLVGTIADLLQRGGSHLGDLHAARVAGSRCPRDGAPLQRRTIGGRTTYSCPRHQR
jgi:formamidopyrimidine-DNA glycosylase